jgi:hypothetical protein
MFTIMIHIGSVKRLAFIKTTKLIMNRELDEYSGMLRVEQPAYGTGFTVIYICQITRAAYLILDNPVRSIAIYKSWVINSHINLETGNKICLYEFDLKVSRDDHNID